MIAVGAGAVSWAIESSEVAAFVDLRFVVGLQNS
jgi:hypothetical protein